MSVFFFQTSVDGQDANIEAELKKAFADLITIASLDEVDGKIAEVPEQRHYLIVGASSRDDQCLGRIIELASLRQRHLFSILVSNEISASDYKRLVRTGAADWVAQSAVPHEILEIIGRTATEAPKLSRAAPLVVTFSPSAGGVGNSTLAVEMSTLLKMRKATAGSRICLVDLDFQSGHACDYLDIEPRLQIEEISNDPGRLDDQLFNIFVSSHPSGLDVFAAPRSKFNVCALNVSALDRLFDMISARYDVLVITLPVSWFGWTSQVLAASDVIVVAGINTVPGLRQMAESLSAVRAVCRPTCQVAAAVNRCEHGWTGTIARRHHVDKVLGRERVFFVRNDPLLIKSANTGRPMVLTNPARKASKDIANLAAYCSEFISSSLPGVSPRIGKALV